MTVPTVEQWEHAGIVEVALDDDLTVKFRTPDLQAWIFRGAMPEHPLIELAARLEFEGVGLEDIQGMSLDEKRNLFDLQCAIVAEHLVEPDLVGELGLEGAREWVATKMPTEHRYALWRRALHVFAPDDIKERFESALADVMSLESFRDRIARVDPPAARDELGEGAG